MAMTETSAERVVGYLNMSRTSCRLRVGIVQRR